MPSSVYLLTRDLMFRSKLAAVVTNAGATVTRDAAACDAAVVEIGATQWEARLEELAHRQVPTVAFGPHVDAVALRQARAKGALAVPNSRVESQLQALLAGP
jgi:hypothetical protein